MKNTTAAYDRVIAGCKDIFIKKAKDYGSSWRVLRTISIADQVFIKAQRIRNIQETGRQQIADQADNEFRGIVNYGVIALIRLEEGEQEEELPLPEIERLYDEKTGAARALMQAKNHDYGEAWREMSQESFVDLILMKLLRIRQILRNNGQTIISEGVDANFTDIINYAVFALIQMEDAA